MEMLQGQMDFATGKPVEGLQHYAVAYGYYNRFSREALEIDTMVEYLHKHLRTLPLVKQREVFQEVMRWLNCEQLAEACQPFMRNVADLVGLSLDAN